MSKRMTEYALTRQTENFHKAGSSKNAAPESLADRMPSPDIAAKVGIGKDALNGGVPCRVVRRKARG